MASSDYKKFNREIKGYVELQSKVKDKNICNFVSLLDGDRDILPIPNGNVFNVGNIINASIKKYNWAILRNNYTLLNGDYNLFNTIWKPYGFISNKKVNELSENAQIILDFNDKVDGITLFFQENPLKNANVYLYNESALTNTLTIENNNDDIIYLDLSEETFTQVIVEVTEWTNNELPIWIRSILLGYGYIYENDELIEFTITEEVNKLVEETPSNELRVTIGDYKKLYDPLNPKGIAKYLTEDAKFIPYIGIRTEDGSFDYDKMGTFYFNKIDYNEKEVTFTCYNLMDKLSKENIVNHKGNLSFLNSWYIDIGRLKDYLRLYLQKETDYSFEVDIQNKTRMVFMLLKYCSFAKLFQDASMMDGIFYVDRNNKIIIRKVNKEIQDSISKVELLNDIKYINVPKINKATITCLSGQSALSQEPNDKDNFDVTYTLEEPYQYFCITSDDTEVGLTAFKNEYLTVTGATSYSIIKGDFFSSNDFYYMLFIRIEGTVGSQVNIKGRLPYKMVSTIGKVQNNKYSFGNGENSVEIENPFFEFGPFISSNLYQADLSNFFDKTYSYKVELEYNGNTKIKAGDYINVESNYGTVPIFVQKHTLKYNGGLSGSIEGVE